MWLDNNAFIEVTKNSPLVSIDLLVEDGSGRFLLGKRLNKPAQGFWFVPGGRILKNQTLNEAFAAIAHRELNLAVSLKDAKLRGVYEHFYEDNFFEIPGFGTHYVVVAYDFVLPRGAFERLPLDQHDQWAFLSPGDIEERADVHTSSKAFFDDHERMNAMSGIGQVIAVTSRATAIFVNFNVNVLCGRFSLRFSVSGDGSARRQWRCAPASVTHWPP